MEKEKPSEKFTFLDPGKLVDDDLELILSREVPADEEKGLVPVYVFEMRNIPTDEIMGYIHFRVGNNEKIFFCGHVGYGVDEKFRGHHYAARSLKLLFNLAKRHGINPLLVTCNPDNLASRKTCEMAGGNLSEIVDLPENNDMYQQGERQKCIYQFTL